MIAELKQKSQLTIPREIIEKLELKIGDTLKIDLIDSKIIITPVAIIPKDQAWFYTKVWQKMERQVDKEIAKGKTYSANSPKELFEQLEKEMIEAGYKKPYAKKHAKAYKTFLDAEKNNELTSW